MEGETVSDVIAIDASVMVPRQPIAAGQTRGTEAPKFNLVMGFKKDDLYAMLTAATDAGASDVKIQSTDYIFVYWKRAWHPFNDRSLEGNEVGLILAWLCGPESMPKISGGGEIDQAPEFFRAGERVLMRFRLNAIGARITNEARGVSITLRTIPNDIPDLAALNLPAMLQQDLLSKTGLKIISGPTGSGKTTLIASVIKERQKEQPGPNIITYEAPAEFPFGREMLGKTPLVSQTEIHTHISDWNRAGPSAMRRKADLAMMGEIRDLETAESTVEMALTGHGVITTIHASTPQETVFRLIEMFPEGSRSAAAAKLLGAIRLIAAVRVVMLKSGRAVQLRSWLNFDGEIKARMRTPAYPYPRWAELVEAEVDRLGQSYVTACTPYVEAGEMGEDMFREVTDVSRVTSRRLYEEIVESAKARAADVAAVAA